MHACRHVVNVTKSGALRITGSDVYGILKPLKDALYMD